jgi:hypothetical protein
MEVGLFCKTNGWAGCWSDFRSIGAVILNAFAYPRGLAPLSHLLLLATAALFAGFDPGIDARTQPRAYLMRLLGALGLLEFAFIGVASVNLTDVPAGVLAVLAIVAFYRKQAVPFALAAGLSVLVRAAYLYPMTLVAVYFIAESAYERRWRRIAALGLYFACLAVQYVATYQHLGIIAFLDPAKVAFWRDYHLSSHFGGYDTLLVQPSPLPWPSFTGMGLTEALATHNCIEVWRLFAGRFNFYFASYVPYGKVYLDAPTDRIFSPIIYAIHFMLLAFSILYLKRVAGWRSLRIAAPVALIVAQSFIIIPEQRFMVVFQMLLLMFGYLYFLSAAAARPQQRSFGFG